MTTYEAICKVLEQEKQDLENARRRHDVAVDQRRDTVFTFKQLIKARKRYDDRVAERERLECLV